MKNIYINIAFGVLISVISMLPGASEAYSYVYNPGYSEPINITNNNVNNNVNTNTNTGTTPVVYTSSYSSNVDYIARHNLPVRTYAHGTHGHVHTSSCYTVCSYRLGGHGCGAAVSIVGATVPKPTCTLVPAISSTGVVELQWTMRGATVAYIDNGIGHITAESGNRVINPQEDTVYNLTVINDAGISGTCTAKVNVTIDDPVDPVDPGDGDGGGDSGGWFGDTFRAIALPIGVAFLILIILLIVIMSKVKNSH